MAEAVFDASAVLAMLRDEPGGREADAYVGRAAISAVNLQEVVKELAREGVGEPEIRSILDELDVEVVPHDSEAAVHAGLLYRLTKVFGRSLGDRSCMALGIALGVPVVTTDREWSAVNIEGLDMRLLR